MEQLQFNKNTPFIVRLNANIYVDNLNSFVINQNCLWFLSLSFYFFRFGEHVNISNIKLI